MATFPSADNDVLTGTSGDDHIDAGAGNDIIYGLAGNDSLFGWDGDDWIDGGEGDDWIFGERGTDTLTGGPGNDIFGEFADWLNGDTITDFWIGDVILIRDADIATFTFSLTGSTLTYTAGFQAGTMTLVGAAGATLAASASGYGGVQIIMTARPPVLARNDFNGDHRSDVLWRGADGTVRDWLGQNNGAFTGNTPNLNITVDNSWHIAGTGDFNGDGRVDILWRHDDGTVRDWLGQTNGGFTGNVGNLNLTVPTDWNIVGIGDFNGDGRSDILWQHDNGTVRDWLGQANGGFVGNTANLNINPGPGWHVAGTGDFNGDGVSDILWHNDGGFVREWLGQEEYGGFGDNVENVNINTGTSWHVVGTGDFNGDGRSDILWRGDDGTVREWLGQPNGGFVGNTAHVNVNPGAEWHVVAIGDFTGDVIDDILWQKNDGTVIQWKGQADGSFADNSANVNINTGSFWHAQDPFVHDPLG